MRIIHLSLIPALIVGATGGDALTLNHTAHISLTTLKQIHESWLPALMAGEDG